MTEQQQEEVVRFQELAADTGGEFRSTITAGEPYLLVIELRWPMPGAEDAIKYTVVVMPDGSHV